MSDRMFTSYRPDVIADAATPPDFPTIQARAKARRRRTGAAVAAAAILVATAVPVVASWRWSGGTIPFGDDPAEQFENRATAVIEAWQVSGLAYSTEQGFLPRQALTTLAASSPEKPATFNVEDTFPSEATYRAYLAGRFRLAGPLSATIPAPVPITFASGGSVTLPMASASAAYAAVDRADPAPDCRGDECVVLTVTGASLGTIVLNTSRGEASVPAWIFTATELRAPIARVAVAAVTFGAATATGTEVLRMPEELLPAPPYGPWAHPVERVEVQAATRLTLHFTGGSCDRARTGRVMETAAAVVVGVATTQAPGLCAGFDIPSSLEVTLAAPLAQRVVLGITDGAPVELRPPG